MLNLCPRSCNVSPLLADPDIKSDKNKTIRKMDEIGETACPDMSFKKEKKNSAF